MDSSRETEDVLAYLVGGAILLLYGPLLLAHFVPEVAAFLIHWHVLATTNVVLPLLNGAGLDFLRLVVAAAVLLVLVLLGFVSARSYARSRARS